MERVGHGSVCQASGKASAPGPVLDKQLDRRQAGKYIEKGRKAMQLPGQVHDELRALAAVPPGVKHAQGQVLRKRATPRMGEETGFMTVGSTLQLRSSHFTVVRVV